MMGEVVNLKTGEKLRAAEAFQDVLLRLESLPEEVRGPMCLMFASKLIETAAFEFARTGASKSVTTLILQSAELGRSAKETLPDGFEMS